jgi:hypothetical protein
VPKRLRRGPALSERCATRKRAKGRPPAGGTPVSDQDYKAPFRFTGKLNKLTLELKPAPLGAVDKKALETKGHRNNAASQ